MSESGRQRRSGLGRGLDALIGGGAEASWGEGAADSPRAAPHAGAQPVPVQAIQPNPRQPRARFDPTALEELAASIRTHGLIQPLVLTAHPQQPGAYWLVAGERRWRAAQMAGLETVPAIVREATPQQLVELALIENVQRADLNPLEEAAAYQSLLEEFRLTQAEVAERVGKSRSAVANSVRLLNLPEGVQRALSEGTVSAGHARALLALPNEALMEHALAETVRKGLNVRQTEILVKRLADAAAQPPPQPGPEPSAAVRAEVARMEERFRHALGTRVALNRNADGSGRLVVHFYNDDDLETLYRLIAHDPD